jgi:hypothetical protein
MSNKTVSFRKGDTWYTSYGMLYQHRGDKYKTVIRNGEFCNDPSWVTILSTVNPIPSEAALGWIKYLGGEIGEEQDRAKPDTVVQYVHRSGGVFSVVAGSTEHAEMDKTIADGRSVYHPLAVASVVPMVQHVYQHNLTGKLRFYTKQQSNLTSWTYVGTTNIAITNPE